MPENTRTLNHKAEALRLLEQSCSVPTDDPGCGIFLQEALVYSNLAIAEGQERVAEAVDALREEIAIPRRRAEEQKCAEPLNTGELIDG